VVARHARSGSLHSTGSIDSSLAEPGIRPPGARTRVVCWMRAIGPVRCERAHRDPKRVPVAASTSQPVGRQMRMFERRPLVCTPSSPETEVMTHAEPPLTCNGPVVILQEQGGAPTSYGIGRRGKYRDQPSCWTAVMTAGPCTTQSAA
jgi:hypothetical protein